MWHDSEVAAIAFAVQNILARRVAEPQQQSLPLDEPEAPAGMPPAMAGKKCSECGAHAVIRKDGCDSAQCGHLGSCGWAASPHHPAEGRVRQALERGAGAAGQALACSTSCWPPSAELLPGDGGAGGVCAVVGAVQVDCATGWLGLPYASGYAVSPRWCIRR